MEGAHPTTGGKAPAKMPWSGKSIAGKGRAGIRRRGPAPGQAISGISQNEIRRLARRGGVKRISGDVTPVARDALKRFLEPVLHDAVQFSLCAGRKTVLTVDVLHALKRNGRTLYRGE